MANEEEKYPDFDAPDEKPESLGREIDIRSRSPSLQIADGRDGENVGTTLGEKLNSTGNSTEKDSIASEKIARSSSGVKGASGDREHFPDAPGDKGHFSDPGEQQHNEHANSIPRDTLPPEEMGQEPSRRLSPVSGIFTNQRRDGPEGTSAGREGMQPVAGENNSGKIEENEALPELIRKSGRSTRRDFPLRKAFSRRLLRTRGYFTQMAGVVEGMKTLLGHWWDFLCGQALTLSSIFGILSVLLMIAAVTSSSWRTHKLTYEDANGFNTITVHAGLRTVQRIHKLSKHNDTATLYLVDAARGFQELIDSPFCVEDPKQVDKDYKRWAKWEAYELPHDEQTTSKASEALVQQPVRRLSDTHTVSTSPSGAVDAAEVESSTPDDDDYRAEPEQETGSNLPRESSSDMDPSHFKTESSSTADGDTDRESYGHVSNRKAQGLDSFQLIFGRDPAAAGTTIPAASKLRRAILGPVVFELNCRHLPKLKVAGDTLWSLVFPALVLSGVALVSSWLSSNWMLSLFRSTAYPTFVLQFISGALWLLVVILTATGLGCWGSVSDVAACVSSTGGASVCMLGISSNLAIAALALQLLASLSCLFNIARANKASQGWTLREVHIIGNASNNHDHNEHDGSPRSNQNYRETRCFKRHCEGLNDVAIVVHDNDRLPPGKQTPPTSTESQSEAGGCHTHRDACNSRLRSRELVESEAGAADQK